MTGFGLWSVPLQGSHVFVFFEGGHILHPRYFATVPGIPSENPNTSKGFNDPDGMYPNTTSVEPEKPNELNEADFHRLARGDTSNTPISYRNSNLDTDVSKADGNTWDEPSSAYSAQYPHNIVFSTHSGLTIEVDSTPGEERYHIFHPSNTFIEVDKDGNVIVKNAKRKYEIVGNDKNIHIMLNHNQTVDGQRTDKVYKDEIRYVGQTREETIVEDVDQTIGENKYIKIGENQTMDVTNNEERTIGNEKDESISSDSLLNVGGTLYINVSGYCKVSSNSRIDIAAPTVHINSVSPETAVVRTPDGVKLEVEDEEIEYTTIDMEEGSEGHLDDEEGYDDGEPIDEYKSPGIEIDEDEETPPEHGATPVASCGDISSPVDTYLILEEVSSAEDLSGNGYIFTVGSLTTGPVVSTYEIRDQAGLTDAEIACNLRAWAENIGKPLIEDWGTDGLVITSGFRHGNGNSQHHLGQAVDLQYPSRTNTELYEIAVWIKDNLNFDQLILEYGGNYPWIHVSYNQDGNRNVTDPAKFGTRIFPGNYIWGTLKNME